MTAKMTKEERGVHGPFVVTQRRGYVLIYCKRCKRTRWKGKPARARTMARYLDDGLLGRFVVRTTREWRFKLRDDLRAIAGRM